jgi:hypothetical protein
VVKHADAVELRIVVAEALAAAADAVLVAHNLPKLGAHLVTDWPTCMRKTSREEAAWRREAGEKKSGGEGGET